MMLSLLLPAAAAMVTGKGNYMECGEGVPLCGVLTVESGLSTRNRYSHDEPVVHGLWPQNGHYGSSQCIAPTDDSIPSEVYSCYDQKGESASDNLGFERHEWGKHGVCAGAQGAEDFFNQVCELSREPLSVLKEAVANGGSTLDTMVEALEQAGFPVWGRAAAATSEFHLSVCAGQDMQWKFAKVEEMVSVCGGANSAALMMMATPPATAQEQHEDESEADDEHDEDMASAAQNASTSVAGDTGLGPAIAAISGAGVWVAALGGLGLISMGVVTWRHLKAQTPEEVQGLDAADASMIADIKATITPNIPLPASNTDAADIMEEGTAAPLLQN